MFYSESNGYLYKYQFARCDPSGIAEFNPRESIDFMFTAHYILRKLHGGDEVLDILSVRYLFPWFLVDLSNSYFDEYFQYRGLFDNDARERFMWEFVDFAHQVKADPLYAGWTAYPVHVAVQIYTVQREEETVDAAMDRAINRRCPRPPYVNGRMLEKLKIAIDNSIKEEEEEEEEQKCCICLNGLAAGEEIGRLQCQHIVKSGYSRLTAVHCVAPKLS